MTDPRDPHWKFSRMRKNDPIGGKSTKSSDDDDEDEQAYEDSLKAFTKRIESRSFEQLYSVVLGLPGRVRQYMRRYRKLQAQGHPDARIADELTEIAKKILDDRIEVAFMVPARLSYDKDRGIGNGPTEEQLDKLSHAAAECDALLTLTAYYFLPGVSSQLAFFALKLSSHPILRTQVAGLADVVDFSKFTKAQRAQRQAHARAQMANEKWDPPEPE